MDLTLNEVAQKLRISRKTVYRWVQEQKLPAYRMGRQFRFREQDIDTWLHMNRMDAALVEENHASPVTHNLAELLKRGGIYYKIDGVTKEEVIVNAVDAMVLPSGVVAARFLEKVLLRERLASTALGKGIAFPHPREPFQLPPDRCSISICFLENPVVFDSPDGQPVRVMFFAFPHDLQHHLRIEARISRICLQVDFTSFLGTQPGRREIVEFVETFENRKDIEQLPGYAAVRNSR